MQVTVKAKYSDAWVKVLKNVRTMGGVQGVKVGIVERATNSHTGENIAFYAACNEFGTKDIPARPFMRMTAEKHSAEWARLFARVTNNQIILTNTTISNFAPVQYDQDAGCYNNHGQHLSITLKRPKENQIVVSAAVNTHKDLAPVETFYATATVSLSTAQAILIQ